VIRVFALEHLLLAALSAGIALAISEGVSYLICVHRLDLTYKPLFGASLLLVSATLLLVVLIGLVASLGILVQRPAMFLLTQSEE
jgi:predicted lysophospholipase L1 biosynthesis ABC-type transport system permease subunit